MSQSVRMILLLTAALLVGCQGRALLEAFNFPFKK